MATDALLGEIRIFGGTFMPEGFVFCDGRGGIRQVTSTDPTIVGCTSHRNS